MVLNLWEIILILNLLYFFVNWVILAIFLDSLLTEISKCWLTLYTKVVINTLLIIRDSIHYIQLLRGSITMLGFQIGLVISIDWIIYRFWRFSPNSHNFCLLFQWGFDNNVFRFNCIVHRHFKLLWNELFIILMFIFLIAAVIRLTKILIKVEWSISYYIAFRGIFIIRNCISCLIVLILCEIFFCFLKVLLWLAWWDKPDGNCDIKGHCNQQVDT